MATSCGTITVVAQFNASDVYVSSCNLQTTSANPGDTVSVDVPVNNDNDTSVQAAVELAVNGSSKETDTRTIGANQTETYTFNFTPQSAGNYTLATEVTSASRA